MNIYKEKSVDINECRQRQPHQSKKACTAKCNVCTESDLNMIKLPCLISSKKKLPRITLISRKGCCQPLSGSKFNVLCYLLYPWHPVVGKQNACLLLLAKITIIYSYPGLLRKCSLCSLMLSICLPPEVFQSHLAAPRNWRRAATDWIPPSLPEKSGSFQRLSTVVGQTQHPKLEGRNPVQWLGSITEVTWAEAGAEFGSPDKHLCVARVPVDGRIQGRKMRLRILKMQTTGVWEDPNKWLGGGRVS